MDEFSNIIDNVINNEEFKKMKNISHHGHNRYDHSYRVAYYTYKATRYLKLDYKSATKGAILHDFFLEENTSVKSKLINTYNHPEYALNNSLNYYELNEIEKDIIRSHMFPINIKVPMYLESWVVDIVDDYVAMLELNSKLKYRFSYLLSIFVMFIIRIIK